MTSTMSLGIADVHIFPSELGWIALAWHGQRLTRLSFGHPSAAAAAASLEEAAEALDESQKEGPAAKTSSPPGWIIALAERLQSYAAGSDQSFADVPVDLDHLSAFQQRVVQACRAIGRGKVRTYGELAGAAGSPGAARAVGNVMSSNRYPIIVPCHRVVGSAGSLGGFSARDGINTKRRMLEMEGAKIKEPRAKRRVVVG
jgi:methylated-DNA-[protein]-cysteine S-methyltransferase